MVHKALSLSWIISFLRAIPSRETPASKHKIFWLLKYFVLLLPNQVLYLSPVTVIYKHGARGMSVRGFWQQTYKNLSPKQ